MTRVLAAPNAAPRKRPAINRRIPFVYDSGRTLVRSQAVLESYTIGQLAAEVGVSVETGALLPAAQNFSGA